MIVCADARRIPLADETVQCVVTSPPYWGLRKYKGEQELDWNGWRGAFGLEPTVEMYVAHTIEILREIRRVLRKDGVVFLNLGDSYAANRGNTQEKPGCDNKNPSSVPPTVKRVFGGRNPSLSRRAKRAPACGTDGIEFRDWMESDCVCSCHDDERLNVSSRRNVHTSLQPEPDASRLCKIGRDSEPLDCGQGLGDGVPLGAQESNMPASVQSSQGNRAVRFCSDCLSSHHLASQPSNSGTLYHVPKPKDLCLIPERVALAAQADGWWVRSRITWAKPNPMPESVTDRPTDATEHIWLFAKSAHYFWDPEAVRETAQYGRREWSDVEGNLAGIGINGERGHATVSGANPAAGRNLRNVWTFATQPYSGAHFATFPEEIPRRCIKAASRVGDLILDPFGGSGTTGRVAVELRRRAVLLDLAYTHDYRELAEKRTRNVQMEAFA